MCDLSDIVCLRQNLHIIQPTATTATVANTMKVLLNSDFINKVLFFLSLSRSRRLYFLSAASIRCVKLPSCPLHAYANLLGLTLFPLYNAWGPIIYVLFMDKFLVMFLFKNDS